MNLLHRLQRRFAEKLAPSAGMLQPLFQDDEHEADGNIPEVAFDEIERLSTSGASLETLLEMNRVQGW